MKICDLAPGQYNVTETLEDGWTNTDPEDGSLEKTVTVSCDTTKTVKFGNYQEEECDGCLKICKYEDKNGNGRRDDGEPYLSGWNFTVTDSHGNSWNVTTGGGFGDATEGLGHDYCDYCETPCLDLPPGEYNVTEVTPLPKGWTNTDPGHGSYTKTVQVSCDDTTTVKFGNYQLRSHLRIYPR